MSHAYASSLFHCVWSTKHREPLIKKELKPRVNSYMRTVIENEGAKLLFINGIEDHIHLLLAMPITMLVPDLIEKVKPVTTKWMNRTFPELNSRFRWQAGYGAFSVGKSNMQEVINYIKNQEEHHKKISYQEEFIGFLEAHGILFDPKLIFD
jgi:putative transposase